MSAIGALATAKGAGGGGAGTCGGAGRSRCQNQNATPSNTAPRRSAIFAHAAFAEWLKKNVGTEWAGVHGLLCRLDRASDSIQRLCAMLGQRDEVCACSAGAAWDVAMS